MIIPVQHIVTMNVPVDANETFEQGYAVALDADGYAIKCDGSQGDNTKYCVGIAADKNRSAESYEFVNRVSDMGHDTGGSGNMSVFTGGIFLVDVDEGVNGNLSTPKGTTIRGVIKEGENLVPGQPLYASDEPGRLQGTDSGAGQIVAYVIAAASEIDSGIPGEYEPGSSLIYADDTQHRQWVKIKLAV